MMSLIGLVTAAVFSIEVSDAVITLKFLMK